MLELARSSDCVLGLLPPLLQARRHPCCSRHNTSKAQTPDSAHRTRNGTSAASPSASSPSGLGKDLQDARQRHAEECSEHADKTLPLFIFFDIESL